VYATIVQELDALAHATTDRLQKRDYTRLVHNTFISERCLDGNCAAQRKALCAEEVDSPSAAAVPLN